MKGIATVLDELMKPGQGIPKPFVDRLLEVNQRAALKKGHEDERDELVCRLLANDMTAEEVSLILKIRVEDIRYIEDGNGDKIADYAKKLKARRKGRERAAAHRQEMSMLIAQRQGGN